MSLFYYSRQNSSQEEVFKAATVGGAASANKVVGTNSSGYIDPTFFSLNGTLDLGGIKYTRSVNPPSSPATGDLWDELANDFLPWRYDGTSWVSRQIYQQFESIFGVSTTPTDCLLASDLLSVRYNVHLIAFAATLRVLTTNSSSAYWSGNLQRLTLDGTATSLSTVDTSLNAVGNVIKSKSLLNLFIDTTTVNTFNVRFTRIGSPGTLAASAGISFRWVRA